ncbi:hypothetical protein [Actinoplanes sp. URMC 104]|uniref:hypothetical protein n=1 Tax=Actinoplanes sp. URMC 104 TaxID=3423409 RepID=UPI003F1DCE19
MPPPQQQPVEIDLTPPESVVEFGPSPEPRRRRWSMSGLGRDLAADRRAVPLAAAVAALAVLASLFSEWQVTTIDPETLGPVTGDRIVPGSVGDLGGFGSAYLVGLFALVASVVLTVAGPPPGRRYARLVGLSVGGTLLGLLLALATSLGSQSLVIDRIYTVALDEGQITVAYGRGVWCAFAGVILAMAALYLAGRHAPTGTAVAAGPVAALPVDEPDPVWSWRRPASSGDDRPADEPLDLTVSPAQPFTSTTDDRDRPR